jgi:hypothetical protein
MNFRRFRIASFQKFKIVNHVFAVDYFVIFDVNLKSSHLPTILLRKKTRAKNQDAIFKRNLKSRKLPFSSHFRERTF